MTTTDKVWGDYPVYYKQPYRWFKYHAHTKPHFAWAVGLGLSAPLLLAISPIRRKYLYSDHEPIPKVYPLPTRPRDTNLTGFDDDRRSEPGLTKDMFNRLGLLHRTVGVQPARIHTTLLKSAKQFHTTKYLQNGNVFGELTKGKEADEAEIEKQNNIDVSQITPATDSTLQEYYLEEAKKSQLTSDKYITPLKRKLFELNVKKNGFFKNNEILKDPETGKVYKLALTEEEIDILEPSIYLQSYRIKSSMKKATQVNRFVRGYKVKNAINQLHFNPKKMSTELEKLLKKGLEQARESNYNEDELYIQALWVGSDGSWRKRLGAKGRGRTGIIEHPHIHLKAILRTDQTANRLKWEKHQKQLNQKPRMFLNNEPLNFRVLPFYRW